MTAYYRSPDTLYHFGIKGMKWGVRRFENEDGTLTEAGKARYTKKNGQLTRKGLKAARKDSEYESMKSLTLKINQGEKEFDFKNFNRPDYYQRWEKERTKGKMSKLYNKRFETAKNIVERYSTVKVKDQDYYSPAIRQLMNRASTDLEDDVFRALMSGKDPNDLYKH